MNTELQQQIATLLQNNQEAFEAQCPSAWAALQVLLDQDREHFDWVTNTVQDGAVDYTIDLLNEVIGDSDTKGW